MIYSSSEFYTIKMHGREGGVFEINVQFFEKIN